MISFTELVTAAQAVRGLLAKGRGHKYIKRIPVGQTPSGGIKYRYIYKETHTVGGKHLLDEAHLKVGTKLLLEDGVHAHITEVKGDKVTFVYDDGDRKGEEKTLTKQKLLSKFDETHDVGAKIDEARGAAERDLETARRSKASEKQLARLEERIKSLKREIESNKVSKLQKKILKSRTVSADKLRKHKEFTAKYGHTGARRPDSMMLTRIEVIESEGIDEAVTSYNNMLERAAADNQGVLTAIEAYQDMIEVSKHDPDDLNKMLAKQAESRDYILKEYGVTPDMTGAEAIQHLKDSNGKYHGVFVREMKERTGIDPSRQGANMTIDLMCSNPMTFKYTRAQLKLDKINSEIATRAREAIQEHITKACEDFSFKDMKYGEGDYHKNHKRDSRKRTPRQRKTMDKVAGVLAHAEDIFERAYPERKLHKTKISVDSGDRAYADMDDENKSTISLTGWDEVTAVHELAHTLEGTYDVRVPYQQRIQEAVTLTHLTRTSAGRDVDLYGGRAEYAFEDKYHNNYTGKLYNNGSSELVTMGVQEFFDYRDFKFKENGSGVEPADPEVQQMKRITDFAITDPHHYLVTYGILKGYAK